MTYLHLSTHAFFLPKYNREPWQNRIYLDFSTVTRPRQGRASLTQETLKF